MWSAASCTGRPAPYSAPRGTRDVQHDAEVHPWSRGRPRWFRRGVSGAAGGAPRGAQLSPGGSSEGDPRDETGVKNRVNRHEYRHRRTQVRETIVGVAGFEPATTCTQSRSSTRLRYTPDGEEHYRRQVREEQAAPKPIQSGIGTSRASILMGFRSATTRRSSAK